MKILIINAGSSSIKFQLLNMPSEKLECNGMVERIGSSHAVVKYKTDRVNIKQNLEVQSHREGLLKIVEYLADPDVGSIRSKEEIDAIGHRVVHGGNKYSDTTVINEEVKYEIRKYADLAPLHNPHNLEGINVAEEIFPNVVQIAVFDTAFHQSLPPVAGRYAIPTGLFIENGIQVYGFHGISHKYVSFKAIDYLKREHTKIITIHLGNGCSMTAVKNGMSVDHSMGFSPSCGLIMGTRSGDIDHGVIFYLVDKLGYSLNEVNTLLTRKSGMLGLTGYGDMRDVESMAARGDKECLLALEMNAYRIRKYIGAYTAAMNGLDAIVFTAGIGENSALIRGLVCKEMEYLGIELDPFKNEKEEDVMREINTAASDVKILVIPTNEELEIAMQIAAIRGQESGDRS